MKKIFLIVFFICFSPAANISAEQLETDPVISKYDLSLFAQAAECLSIKSSENEKMNFIKAAYLDKKVNKSIFNKDFDKKIIEEYAKTYDNDFESIIKSLKKHCPNISKSIIFRLDNFKYDNEVFLNLLQDYIVTVIFSEIADKKERIERFESNNMLSGETKSPY